jgi:pyridinium-3,5-bisthiocarboxylic acid mononucleotide nickel chelatase
VSRVVYFDCANGAAGDMLLGAIVDLGLPLDELRAELAKLPLQGYALRSSRVSRSGLAATKVDVEIHAPETQHRHLRHIVGIIDSSTLDAEVKDKAKALFHRLAEAEGKVHGTSPEKVHFHEVGAVDSIVDIVGGVIGLRWLGAARFVASPLNLGSASVTMSHGTVPVPPPATAHLVTGVPVFGAGDGELLTPTGALLVTSYATAYGPLPALRIEKTGHGAGTRDTQGRPNVLRLIVGEETHASGSERVLVLETEVDDTAPQLLGPLIDGLLAAGALDAFYTAVQMKKGRPGVLVTVIAPPDRREAIEELLFRETTTLGVRRQEWERTTLERETASVATEYGGVRIKIGRRGGVVYNAWPEFEDCQRLAGEKRVAVKEVLAAALAAWRAGAGKA